MSGQLNTENAGEKILLIYSEKGCMKKHLPKQKNGLYSFYLSASVTGGEEKEFFCNRIQGDWYVKDERLSGRAPAYLVWEGVQLILFLSEELTCLQPCMKLEGKQEEEITVTKLICYLSSQPAVQEKLTVARDNLINSATKMQTVNQQNEILLKQAIELTEFDITLFKSMRQAPETANYNKNAYNTGTLLGGSGFDAKQ